MNPLGEQDSVPVTQGAGEPAKILEYSNELSRPDERKFKILARTSILMGCGYVALNTLAAIAMRGYLQTYPQSISTNKYSSLSGKYGADLTLMVEFALSAGLGVFLIAAGFALLKDLEKGQRLHRIFAGLKPILSLLWVVGLQWQAQSVGRLYLSLSAIVLKMSMAFSISAAYPVIILLVVGVSGKRVSTNGLAAPLRR